MASVDAHAVSACPSKSHTNQINSAHPDFYPQVQSYEAVRAHSLLDAMYSEVSKGMLVSSQEKVKAIFLLVLIAMIRELFQIAIQDSNEEQRVSVINS